MCDNGKRNRMNDNMAKNTKESKITKSNEKKQDLKEVLNKGIERYDKALKKLSKN